MIQNWHSSAPFSTRILRTVFDGNTLLYGRPKNPIVLFLYLRATSTPMKSFIFILLICISCIVVEAQDNFDTVSIRPVQVAENIYFLKGAGGNIGVFIGKEGTLMIDNQFAPLSNKINGAIKTLSPNDIRFLINTHLHGDHSGGNENFKNMGVTIVAHDMVRDRMSKEQVNKTNNTVTPPRPQEAWPIITFSEKLNFYLNQEDIELIHVDSGAYRWRCRCSFQESQCISYGGHVRDLWISLH